MGRETLCSATWYGATSEVKALLESDALILRGEIKQRFPRASLGKALVDADALVIKIGRASLRLEMGSKEAAKWVAALEKPLPSLAAKLGLSADKPAFVLGTVDDDALAAALQGNTTKALQSAAVIVAVIATESDLKAALALARKTKAVPIWFVYGKGKHATVSDATIRSFARDHGLVDTKTSSVSERLTATRYSLRQAK